MRQPTPPPQDVAEIIRLYHAGLGAREITRRVDVSESTAVRILRGQHRHNKTRIMHGKRPGAALAVYRPDQTSPA